MFDFTWIDPAWREFASEHRLDDLAAVLSRRDAAALLPAHRGRDAVRLQLPSEKTPVADAPGSRPDASGSRCGLQTLFLKREAAPRWKDLARHAFAGQGFWTLARAEFEVLRRLAEHGIGCPKPIVCLQRGGSRPRACLILQELAGKCSLSASLSQMQGAARGERESLFAAVAREVARLHSAGVNQPDLYANHVFVAAEGSHGGRWQVAFIDFQRSAVRSRVPLGSRAADLAALWATLPRRLADARDREAFFDAYLAAADLEDRGMEFVACVSRHVERLLTRRRIWEIRESDTEEHRAVHSLESVEMGKMWVDRDFRPALDGDGLSSFEAVMSSSSGRLLRALPDRENWRLELHSPHEAPRGAYLKRHHVRTARAWLRAAVGAGPGQTAGRVEVRNVARLSRAGIAAMKLIAYGEKLHKDGLLESFVLTEELVGYTQLDHFLRQRFPARDGRNVVARDGELGQLIREVAAVAAKFHKLGYNHRDLYCCHFFIKESQPGRFKVNLIDLQRVEHRRNFRSRWLVKDLAQLAYSAPRDRISCTQRMAFIKRYLGVAKLRPQDKRLVRQVLRKQRWMELKMGAHP